MINRCPRTTFTPPLALRASALAVALLCAGMVQPAATQPAFPDALSYTATLRFDLAAERLDGDAIVDLRNPGSVAMSRVTLHLRDLTVSAVLQGATVCAFTQADGLLDITLPAPLAPGEPTALRIRYGGRATSEAGPSSWGGCFWGATTFSMGVGFFAPYVSMTRHWLPSHDIPSDKARFDLTYIVPEGYAAAGTGRLVSTATVPGGGSAWRWLETHPTATYLVTYAISRYAVIRDAWRGLPLEYWVPRTDSTRGASHFATIPAMLEAFTAAFGPYPFDKVGYCLTPIGAMEHQTMISYPTSLLFLSQAGETAAHELAHQWWGDCVTPADFRDAWLSEGFATFSEAIYDEHRGGRAAYLRAAVRFASDYRSQVQPSEGTFALYDFPRAAPSSNYPQTIYKKGAAVLVMLRHMMGDTLFFSGLRDYLAKHAYGSAATGDFRAAMERAWGSPLDWFFDQWVMKPGYPNYTLYTVNDSPSAPARFLLQQSQDTTVQPLFRMPVDVWIVRTSGDTLRRVIEHDAVYRQWITFQDIRMEEVRAMLFDPLNIVLKRVSYRTLSAPPEGSVPGMRLENSYPQPSDPDGITSLPFHLDRPGSVRIDVCDALGRSVVTVADGQFDPGRHVVRFRTAGLAAGTYAVRLRSAAAQRIGRLVVAR